MFLAGSVVQAAAAPVVIQFESLPDGTPLAAGTVLSNQFTSRGVSFSSFPPFQCLVSDSSPAASGRRFLAASGANPGAGYEIDLRFNPPARRVGSVFVQDDGIVQVHVFDPQGGYLGSAFSDGSSSGFDSWEFASPSGIGLVAMVGGRTPLQVQDWWGMDDLTFEIDGPRLDIATSDARHVSLSWPTNAVGYALEQSSSLSGAAWDPVTNAVAVSGGAYSVLVPADAGDRFFRLRRN